MNRRLTSLSAVLLVVGVTAVAPSASAAVKKCHGQKATVTGTSAPDQLQGSKGADVIVGLGGDDVIFAGGGNDLICGGGGYDQIVAEGGKDLLLGGGADDFLVPGPGNDRVVGGPGGDSVHYYTSPGPVSVDLPAGRATGAEGTDTLATVESVGGSEFADTITGDDMGNLIQADDGNDVISTGAGVDLVAAEGGDDTVDLGADFDAMVYLFSSTPVQVDLASGTATGEGNDTFTGAEATTDSPFNDTVVGNNDTNLFIAGPGDDVIQGQGGVDLVLYWLADQPMNVDLGTGKATGFGSDTLNSVEGAAGSLIADNTLAGNGDANILWGGIGKDQMYGKGGDDLLQGVMGDDLYDGGAGTFDGAILSGGTYPVHADLTTGDVTGNGSAQLVGIEALEGTEWDDVLIGDGLGNVIYGMGGNDQITGGEGADFLHGGEGADQTDGGGGSDNCAFTENPISCEASAEPPLHPLAGPVEVATEFKRNF